MASILTGLLYAPSSYMEFSSTSSFSFLSLETLLVVPSFPASFASQGKGWKNPDTSLRSFVMPQNGEVVFQQSLSSCLFVWFQENKIKEKKKWRMRITSKSKIRLFSIKYLQKFLLSSILPSIEIPGNFPLFQYCLSSSTDMPAH